MSLVLITVADLARMPQIDFRRSVPTLKAKDTDPVDRSEDFEALAGIVPWQGWHPQGLSRVINPLLNGKVSRLNGASQLAPR